LKDIRLIEIPSRWVFAGCCVVALLIGALPSPLSTHFIVLELFLTIGALFLFGSIRYRISNNALTYGALLIIFATFYPHSSIQKEINSGGLGPFLYHTTPHLFSLSYMEKLLHADTMLFILGLTFFVSVIAQTRMLEAISMRILRFTHGQVFKTVAIIITLVAIASGIMDGVSMIGLTIRVLVFILIMAKIDSIHVEYIVMISVIVTTVCGIWMAYGEPPNLIIKSNLGLPDSFFLLYTMPLAVVTLILVVVSLYRRLAHVLIPMNELDLLERHIADIRFYQVQRMGKMIEPDLALHAYDDRLGDKREAVWALYHEGHYPIEAMILAGIDPAMVLSWIEAFLGPQWGEPLYAYYLSRSEGTLGGDSLKPVAAHLTTIERQRKRAAFWSQIAFIPFIALLVLHAASHTIPLFLSSAVGFFVAAIGMLPYPQIKRRMFHDAVHEYKEYLFLFPLFLSISMLAAVGFFDVLKGGVTEGVALIGVIPVAEIQFILSALLSAVLDNNVVADFASRAIVGMPDLFLFAAAQIAGYATGGGLTHIGSAQSVIAYAYILRHINRDFTPFLWVRAVWKLIGVITLVLMGVLYLIAKGVG
jgi:Na+/H+ antiporter NhaD/arsenite permease-like protein